jgi:hypothetical protein
VVAVGDLSLVFHVFSLVAFAALTYRLLQLRAVLKLWRDWNTGGLERKVTVGEPIRVLRQFSDAVGADFESSAPLNALAVSKVKLDGCFKLHKDAGIKKICVTKAEKCRVDFVLVREPSIIPSELDKISLELGGAIEVGAMAARHP